MRDINEITFDEFYKMIKMINFIVNEDKASFEQMLTHVCKDCRLADELYYVICEIYKKIGEFPESAVEHHKAVLAVWVLLNDYKFPNTTAH